MPFITRAIGGFCIIPARKPAPPPFPQREGASAKQLLLFDLVRARAQLLAALQGLAAGPAESRPGGGAWSIRETVLHLHACDLEVERALEPGHGHLPLPHAREVEHEAIPVDAGEGHHDVAARRLGAGPGDEEELQHLDDPVVEPGAEDREFLRQLVLTFNDILLRIGR